MYDLAQRFLLFMVGVTLPLQAFSLINVGIRLTPFKLATAVLLAVAVMGFLMGRRRGPDPSAPWVGVLAVAFGISCVQGFLRGVGVAPLLQSGVQFYAILLYYLLIGYVVRTREDLKILLWGLVAGGVLTSAPSVLGLQGPQKADRYYGLSGQPNVFGMDMVIVIAVSIGLYSGTRNRALRAALVGAVIFAMGGMFLSLSRTAFVAALGMGALWLYRSRRVDTLRYAVPALLLFVVAIGFAPDAVKQRFNTIVDARERAEDGSIQGRISQFYLGSEAFLTNPLIGIGHLAFVNWARDRPGTRHHHNVIHNAYLSLAVSTGLLGLIPYLMVLATCWRQYSRAYRLTRSRRALKDPWLIEYHALTMFLPLALFGSMLAGLTAHSQKSKTAWLILALAPVMLNLVRARIHEIETPVEMEPEEPVHFGALPGRTGV